MGKRFFLGPRASRDIVIPHFGHLKIDTHTPSLCHFWISWELGRVRHRKDGDRREPSTELQNGSSEMYVTYWKLRPYFIVFTTKLSVYYFHFVCWCWCLKKKKKKKDSYKSVGAFLSSHDSHIETEDRDKGISLSSVSMCRSVISHQLHFFSVRWREIRFYCASDSHANVKALECSTNRSRWTRQAPTFHSQGTWHHHIWSLWLICR